MKASLTINQNSSECKWDDLQWVQSNWNWVMDMHNANAIFIFSHFLMTLYQFYLKLNFNSFKLNIIMLTIVFLVLNSDEFSINVLFSDLLKKVGEELHKVLWRSICLNGLKNGRNAWKSFWHTCSNSRVYAFRKLNKELVFCSVFQN